MNSMLLIYTVQRRCNTFAPESEMEAAVMTRMPITVRYGVHKKVQSEKESAIGKRNCLAHRYSFEIVKALLDGIESGLGFRESSEIRL